jgi:hypothetical protein
MTYDEALEILNGEGDPKTIPKRLLNRKVWVSEWSIPGCLPEARDIHRTKADAIESALMYAEGEDGPPRGMLTALHRDGIFYCHSPIFGEVVTGVYQDEIGSCF